MLRVSLFTLALVACGDSSPTASAPTPAPAEPAPAPAEPAEADATLTQAQALFAALPDFMAAESGKPSDALIDLGRRLYYEKRLSKNHDISCNSCHDLAKYGVDGEPTSPGHKGVRGDRNSPTSLNAALHATQFWDGREPTVEAQALGPILNPVEMAMADDATVVKTLKSIPGYTEAFGNAFPDAEDPVTYANVGAAIGAFERGLVTPSPFDAYLKGDTSALSDAQKEGLKTFVSTGCTACHNGVAVGGQGFFKLGQAIAYETEDQGRAKVTGSDTDQFMFKPPSLRNITKTGPYLHDGSVTDLGEMVKLMGKHQLGKDLSDAETSQILAFLESMTGEVDATYVKEPEAFENGPDTPSPDPS